MNQNGMNSGETSPLLTSGESKNYSAGIKFSLKTVIAYFYHNIQTSWAGDHTDILRIMHIFVNILCQVMNVKTFELKKKSNSSL